LHDGITSSIDGITSSIEGRDFLFRDTTHPPDELERASLAIIGAHGTLHEQNRWFQILRDEGSVWLTPEQIAEQVSGSHIVVLFVCSGGRIDENPLLHAGIGLPRQILDKGVQTVVASPWPLDSAVPSHWLPKFLDSLEAGNPVVEANYYANRSVAEALDQNPVGSLAMNVFGDPTTTLS